jgi:hypothetical protein
MGAFARLMTKTKIKLAFKGIIISQGIVFGVFIFFIVVAQTLFWRFYPMEDDIIERTLALFLSLMSVLIFFNTKKYKKGIPFLEKHADVAAVISIIIITIFITINNSDTDADGYIYDFLAFSLIIASLCMIGLIFWLKDGAATHYREKMWRRNHEKDTTLIAEKDRQLQEILIENDAIAEENHTHRKMVRGFELGLNRLFGMEAAVIAAKLPQAKKLLDKYSQIGAGYTAQKRDNTLPQINNFVIDNIIMFMKQKADEKAIQFTCMIDGSISWVDSVVCAVKLGTICSDLIENCKSLDKPSLV